MSDSKETIKRLATTLDEIAVALNDWYAERKAAHEERVAGWRRQQTVSMALESPAWVYAEETIRRDEAEKLEPIRLLMRKADAALAIVEGKK